ncbi:Pur regulon 18 kDa protein [Kingella potus]|uniref:Pur regulon 18 kDa protein n=1 Tax=Kingella potus TaxID=265175 RepID=A0A377R1M1_9NEIS|nr:CvpA family protein [Kingella potus]STR00989.1 Pur regulon 18 kDa protein [Kingella potus]
MTLFDISALAVIVLSTVFGAMRGMIGEVLSLVSWLFALSVAKLAAAPLGATLLSSVNPPILATAAGFVAAFAAVLLAMSLLRPLLTGGAKAVGLGGINRLLGALYGIVRGAAAVTLAVLICAFTDLPQSEDWRQSYSAPFFEGAAEAAVPYLPAYLAEKITRSGG